MENDIFIIADDINFEVPYFNCYFQGKNYHYDIVSFIKEYMRTHYDEDVKFKKKYSHFFISDNKGKVIMYYKDCSCSFGKKHGFLTKEIFFYKIKRF